MELITQIVMFVIFVVTLSTWTVIGLLFWVPMLARVTAVFSIRVLYATISNQNADEVREYLRMASSFYADGFRVTRQAIYRSPDTPGPRPRPVDFGRVCFEFLWAGLFWLGLAWLWFPDALVQRITASLDAVSYLTMWFAGVGLYWRLYWLVLGMVLVFVIGAAVGFYLSRWGEGQSATTDPSQAKRT